MVETSAVADNGSEMSRYRCPVCFSSTNYRFTSALTHDDWEQRRYAIRVEPVYPFNVPGLTPRVEPAVEVVEIKPVQRRFDFS